MAVTYTRVPDGNDVWGRTRMQIVDITLDTSYPLTAGYVIRAQDVGLKGIFGAKVIGGNKAAGAILPTIDLGTVAGPAAATSVILRAFLPSGGATAPATLTAPVAAATTSGAITIGGTATATPAAGATPVTSTGAQPAIPVDLSAVTATPAAGTAGAITAGIGKEVGNTTNLSSIIVRVMFFGR